MLFRTKRFRAAQLVALSLAAVLSLACGDGLPAGPEGVFETSDTTANGAMQAMVTDGPGVTGQAKATYSGTMTGHGDVEVSTNNKTWYTMGAPRDFTVELQSDASTVELTASAEVPTGTYRFVRVNWSGTMVNLKAGSRIGNATLDSDVSLRLGDASTAVMHQEVGAFDLVLGAQARIVVDLNSEQWMTEDFLTALEIHKEKFADKAKISIVAGT